MIRLETPVVVSSLDMSWRDDAECKTNTDPDLFFPHLTEPRGVGAADKQRDGESAPKALCASCRVSVECLDWAVATGQQWGIWGGMTPRERRAEVRRRKAEARRAS